MSALDPVNVPALDADDPAATLLPPRRRRRVTTATALLALATVVAAAFIGGVEVQKHFGESPSASGTGSGLSGPVARSGGGAGATGGLQRAGGASAGGFGAAGDTTFGLVTLIKGSTLYVTDFSGNTVKVTTKPDVRVSKTVASSLKGIHPGDSVVVRGTKAKQGSLAATSISIANNGDN